MKKTNQKKLIDRFDILYAICKKFLTGLLRHTMKIIRARDIIIIILIVLFVSHITGLAVAAQYSVKNCREANCISNDIPFSTALVDFPNYHEEFTHITLHQRRKVFRSSLTITAGEAPVIADCRAILLPQTTRVSSKILSDIFNPPKNTL